ncbi:MAG: cadmium-translocating P-type ATPase [Clostridiaceae bacterium]|nr:cadmium-translocating P-type ATPase [Clostridiaceae bacterium]
MSLHEPGHGSDHAAGHKHGNEHGHEPGHGLGHESGHELGHANHLGNIRLRLIVSLILSIPIFFFAPFMGREFFFTITFPGSDWITLIFATALYFYGGWPFLKGAKMEIGHKNPAMMTLITLGISTSYFYSLYAFINNNFFSPHQQVMDFFWELATLILIMLLGHWVENTAIEAAGNAVKRMAELLPGTATIIEEDGSMREIDLQEVVINDLLLVRAGDKVPTDGVIIEGSTTVNESMLTGEAMEVMKSIQDEVIGGSLNGAGTITIEVTGTGESGFLAQVMKLVSSAQREKARVEMLADKVAKWLFYAALAVGILALVIWLLIAGDLSFSVERMVAVFVIACPHALGLAVPLVVARSTSLAAQNGLLIKRRSALEAAEKLDLIMMDKTGTLTAGEFTVNAYESFVDGLSDEDALALMGAVEQGSGHPLAVGVLKKVKELGLDPAQASDVQNLPGMGISGKVEGRDLMLVSVSYLLDKGIAYDEDRYLELSSRGNSVSFLLINGVNSGIIAQGDRIKPGAGAMIDSLQAEGIRPIMLTGDNKQSAEVVAGQLGIEEVYADLLPQDKERIVKEYRDQGHKVMMVGDGINDAPALSRADVAVAIGAGTDVAIDSADIILVKSEPADILHILSLAKNTSRKMRQNLVWGAGYNFVAIPLAAGILAARGMILSPAVGAILMSLSTIIVAINAITLKMD